MDRRRLETLLKRMRSGEISVQDAFMELRDLPYRDLGDAKLDVHRALRRGFPEVVYCPGKSPSKVVDLLRELSRAHSLVLATRASPSLAARARREIRGRPVAYHEAARIIAVGRAPRKLRGSVLVVTAGTSDVPVAEEAAVTAEAMGSRVSRLYDVGVAGVHRVLDRREDLRKARVIVVAAGMEGALPSVIAGLVEVPVIAVPTSVGYGASFRGLAALLAMMNSCAPGVAVVNIDNGFGAGYLAAVVNR